MFLVCLFVCLFFLYLSIPTCDLLQQLKSKKLFGVEYKPFRQHSGMHSKHTGPEYDHHYYYWYYYYYLLIYLFGCAGS